MDTMMSLGITEDLERITLRANRCSTVSAELEAVTFNSPCLISLHSAGHKLAMLAAKSLNSRSFFVSRKERAPC